jgi:hypothetical protein
MVIPSKEVFCTILRNKDPKSKTPKNKRMKKVQGQVKTIFPNIKSKKKKIRRDD